MKLLATIIITMLILLHISLADAQLTKWTSTGSADITAMLGYVPLGTNAVPAPYSITHTKQNSFYITLPGGATTTTISSLGDTINTSGTASSIAASSGFPHGVKLTSSSGPATASVGNGVESLWTTNDFIAHFKFQLASDFTSNLVFVAWDTTNGNLNGGTSSETVGFRFSHNVPDTHWVCYAKGSSGSPSTVDSGVTPATGVLYDMLLVKSGSSVVYYINGSSVGTNTWPTFTSPIGMFWAINNRELGANTSAFVFYEAYYETSW